MTTQLPDHNRIITIERFILEQEHQHPEATGVLTSLLYDLALAGKYIASRTTRAGLAEILGATDQTNIQGETVMRLDELADQTIYRLNDHTGRLAGMVSEEHEHILPIPERYPTGKYVLLYDPLDGSSNIDYNATLGTIFAIFRRKSRSGPGVLEDFLQPAKELVAAGYLIYGASTMLVYSTGQGVHGFTLDPTIGEFLLSHPNLHYPARPRYYSANQGYQRRWSPGVQRYTRWLQGLEGGVMPLSSRYIGALVGDFHRNLLAGGVYFYPGETDAPQGKLRLLYEAGPLAFLAEQAGGAASDGSQRILEIHPASLHQRTPFFVGNADLVRRAVEFIQQDKNTAS